MSPYPTFPPGFWRQIRLHPASGRIGAGLEDDVHRFTMRLDHADGIITAAEARTERAPWSTCAGAGPFIAGEIVGERLVDVAARDPMQHCTHLLDLAILCAAHAGDTRPLCLDMQVSDRVNGRRTATLFEDGKAAITWALSGTLIDGPSEWGGRDLRRLRQWQDDLDPADISRAQVLRRAVFVSGARDQPRELGARAADRAERLGVCYTYQPSRAPLAVQDVEWRRDFSIGTEGPLAGFDPASLVDVAGGS